MPLFSSKNCKSSGNDSPNVVPSIPLMVRSAVPIVSKLTVQLPPTVGKDCTLIIVEHDLEWIKDICDNLTVLDQGKVLDDGTVEHIESSQRVKEVYTSRV